MTEHYAAIALTQRCRSECCLLCVLTFSTGMFAPFLLT
jgi:hypothetical protein